MSEPASSPSRNTGPIVVSVVLVYVASFLLLIYVPALGDLLDGLPQPAIRVLDFFYAPLTWVYLAVNGGGC